TGQVQTPRNPSALGRERSPPPAAATRTPTRRAAPDYHVSKLTRRATLTAINLAIENDSSADTFSDQHEYEVSRVVHFRPAKPEFGKCNGVSVVVDHDGQTDSIRDHFGDRKIAPEEVRNVKRGAGGWIDQTRKTHTDAF